MKTIHFFLDRSLPAQGRARVHAWESSTAMGGSRTVGVNGPVQSINSLHPGEGSA